MRSIQHSTADGIGHVVIDNPQRLNAMSLAMWQAMDEAMQRFAADPQVRCVIVSGAGSRAFSAGADISEFESIRSGAQQNALYHQVAYAAMQRIQQMAKPSIAMISGHCLGGGLALAICCDLRIGSADARFAIPAAKLGLGYDHKSVKRLCSLVGPSKAKQLLYSASTLSAAEAHRIGLVDEVVEAGAGDGLREFTNTLAARIAANAPLTIAAAKFAAELAMRDATESDRQQAGALELACFASEDYAEGRRAFMEKRPSQFRGR